MYIQKDETVKALIQSEEDIEEIIKKIWKNSKKDIRQQTLECINICIQCIGFKIKLKTSDIEQNITNDKKKTTICDILEKDFVHPTNHNVLYDVKKQQRVQIFIRLYINKLAQERQQISLWDENASIKKMNYIIIIINKILLQCTDTSIRHIRIIACHVYISFIETLQELYTNEYAKKDNLQKLEEFQSKQPTTVSTNKTNRSWKDIAKILEILLNIFKEYTVSFLHIRYRDIEPDIRSLIYSTLGTFYIQFSSFINETIIEKPLLLTLQDPEIEPALQSLNMWKRILREITVIDIRNIILKYSKTIQEYISLYLDSTNSKLCARSIDICTELLLLDTLEETEKISSLTQLLWDSDIVVREAATHFIHEDSFSPKIQQTLIDNQGDISQNDWIEFSKLLYTFNNTDTTAVITPLQRQCLADTLVNNFAHFTVCLSRYSNQLILLFIYLFYSISFINIFFPIRTSQQYMIGKAAQKYQNM